MTIAVSSGQPVFEAAPPGPAAPRSSSIAASIMSIKGRVAGVGAVGFLCALTIAVAAYWSLSTVVDDMTASQQAAALHEAAIDLDAMFDAIRDDVIVEDGDGAANNATAFAEHRKQFDDTLQLIRRNPIVRTTTIAQQLSSIEHNLQSYLNSADGLFADAARNAVPSESKSAQFRSLIPTLEQDLSKLNESIAN